MGHVEIDILGDLNCEVTTLFELCHFPAPAAFLLLSPSKYILFEVWFSITDYLNGYGDDYFNINHIAKDSEISQKPFLTNPLASRQLSQGVFCFS